MKKNSIWPCLFPLLHLLLVVNSANSEEEIDRNVLVEFILELSHSNGFSDPGSGWNLTSFPCKDSWKGITCQESKVISIFLDGLNFSGTLDAKTLCSTPSLAESLMSLTLRGNSIHGENLEEIANCSQLRNLDIGNNQFSGSLPDSFSSLQNLESLDISQNQFSGLLPNLDQISGLTVFLAQENHFIGAIPTFNFSNFLEFNVSYNNFSGAIPDGGERFTVDSFLKNPSLCGSPLPKECPPLDSASPVTSSQSPSPSSVKSGLSRNQILIFTGYFLIGLGIMFLILLWVYKKCNMKEENLNAENRVAALDESYMKPSFASVELNAGGKSKTEISAVSAESGMVSSSLIVLTSPEVNGLRFEDLLRAPAELLGRGNHGSVYKVSCNTQRMMFAVKRIKDWTIPSNDFKHRMRRLDQVKHPHVLPALAFYSSSQEKLLVYEYQQNGSLFRRIHGNSTGQVFDWESRLSAVSAIANALAFMHEELREDRIPHGDLKSSNILLNKNMEPCISEYGLMVVHNTDQSIVAGVNNFQASDDNFKADVYGFGVILLEMLTGKMVLNNGVDLATWVLAVVREEWTVEVFDRSLIHEGASEERMVNLLQVAIKCVNKSPEARPNMDQVALMISKIKEEDDKSMDVSGLSYMTSWNG